MNKRLFPLIIAIVMLQLMFVLPLRAQMDSMCTGDMTTVASLQECVKHAYAMGHIDNKGVAKSLLKKLDAAQAAVSRGQDDVAINNLDAFINAVEAQSSKQIAAEHAAHMIHHAEMVIAALSQ
jgi:cell division FtsZ-interacting protein ZapD